MRAQTTFTDLFVFDLRALSARALTGPPPGNAKSNFSGVPGEYDSHGKFCLHFTCYMLSSVLVLF